MAPNLTDTPVQRTIDLTGLPEPFVQQVERLVQAERDRQAGPPADAANGSPNAQPTPDAGDPPWVSEAWPRFISRPRPSREEFRRLLDEMAAMSSGQSLPADWSRADIYDDHD